MPTTPSTTLRSRDATRRRRVAICLLLLTAFTTHAQPSTAPNPPSWQPIAPMPRALIGHAASAANNRLLVTGGLYASTTLQGPKPAASADVFAYDPEQDRWQAHAQLPRGRFNHAQIMLSDGRLLIVGGSTYNDQRQRRPLAGCLLLDPETGQIEPGPELPEPMSAPTVHRVGALGESPPKIVAIGGRYAAVLQGDRWLPIKLQHPRTSHAVVRFWNGTALVIGGTGQDTLELVDLHDLTSELLPVRLPQALDDHAAVSFGGGIAVLGGQYSRGGNTTSDTLTLDLSRSLGPRQFKPGPSLGVPLGMADHRTVPFIPADQPDARAYLLIGGESQLDGQDTELADTRIVTGHPLRITTGPTLPQPHDDAAVVPHFRGHSYVLGGAVTRTVFGRTVPVPVSYAHRLDLTRLRIER
ncbi:MAG: hypothetical protein AAGI68_05255 [Planctomycetota bacterium]